MKNSYSANKGITKTIAIIIIALVASTAVTTVLYLDSRSRYDSLNQSYNSLQNQFGILQGNYSSLKNNYAFLNEKYSALESSYNILQTNYSTLQNNYSSLRSEYDQLNLKYNKLQDNYNNLTFSYNNLKSSYDQLTLQFNKLQDNYNNLNYNYTNLKSDYISLNSQYTSLQYTLTTWEQLHIGTTLETYYDYVRANVMTIGGHPLGEEEWWAYPNWDQESATFAAEIAAHDAGNAYWSVLENESNYYSHTGEFSYQTAGKVLLQAMILANITYADTAVTKIDKIMKFTSSIVHYESRLIDHMWFPTETLAFRSGDCTSFSILESALFEMAGVTSSVSVFRNDQGDGHAMILVHLEDLGVGKHYYYYPDLTSYGLSEGKWIIIEPQFDSLSQQQSKQDQWIPQWKIVAAAEVPYGA